MTDGRHHSPIAPYLVRIVRPIISRIAILRGCRSTSDVEVRHTYYGDANLDGRLDGSDYSKIDNGYIRHLSGWSNGDFNYDGVVDGSDYTLIDNAFNRQTESQDAQIAVLNNLARVV
jgi:hypothetical protein